MRTSEDVLRSVRRYVASALGSPPWRVRLAMDARFKRPFALVNAPVESTTNIAGPSSVREHLPIVVQCYPVEPSSDGPMRTTEARLIAERAGEALKQAITVGVADATDATVRGHWQRIPLWDYTDANGNPLPLEGSASIATARKTPDYLLVEDGWTVRVMPEASEQQLFVALLNMRVQWFRPSLVDPGRVTTDGTATTAATGGTVLESLRLDELPH